jgi:undecaprenyl-diphosphatase
LTPPPDRPALERLLQADADLSRRLVAPPGPARLLALAVAHSGDSPIWLIAAAAAILWGGPAWRPLGVSALAANLVGGAVATLSKWLFRRQRPGKSTAALYLPLDRLSFPSGHATRVACMTVLLAPLLPAWAVALLAAWAVLVPLARVALQVHYVSDVVAGWMLGGLVGIGLRIAF